MSNIPPQPKITNPTLKKSNQSMPQPQSQQHLPSSHLHPVPTLSQLEAIPNASVAQFENSEMLNPSSLNNDSVQQSSNTFNNNSRSRGGPKRRQRRPQLQALQRQPTFMVPTSNPNKIHRKTSKRRQAQEQKQALLELFKDLIGVVNQNFIKTYSISKQQSSSSSAKGSRAPRAPRGSKQTTQLLKASSKKQQTNQHPAATAPQIAETTTIATNTATDNPCPNISSNSHLIKQTNSKKEQSHQNQPQLSPGQLALSQQTPQSHHSVSRKQEFEVIMQGQDMILDQQTIVGVGAKSAQRYHQQKDDQQRKIRILDVLDNYSARFKYIMVKPESVKEEQSEGGGSVSNRSHSHQTNNKSVKSSSLLQNVEKFSFSKAQDAARKQSVEQGVKGVNASGKKPKKGFKKHKSSMIINNDANKDQNSIQKDQKDKALSTAKIKQEQDQNEAISPEGNSFDNDSLLGVLNEGFQSIQQNMQNPEPAQADQMQTHSKQKKNEVEVEAEAGIEVQAVEIEVQQQVEAQKTKKISERAQIKKQQQESQEQQKDNKDKQVGKIANSHKDQQFLAAQIKQEQQQSQFQGENSKEAARKNINEKVNQEKIE